MKIYGAGLTAHLQEDSTSLCYCWRIQRRDNTVFGFTDHDRDLVVAGTTYLATTGVTTTKMVRRLGLSVDNLELEGAIDDDALTTLDIERGLYDDAAVELRMVNWKDTTQFDLLATGTFGNAKMVEQGFAVEFRSQAHALNQPIGRIFQRNCDAKLGDSRCKAVVPTTNATVASVSGHVVNVTTLAQADTFFALGKLVDAAGTPHKIKTQIGTKITLWEVPVVPIGVGTTIVLTPGCRQTFDVCKTKFNNAINFQGFPYIPGNDAMSNYPIRGKDNYDGGSLFK